MHRDDLSVVVVGDVERLLVFRRKGRAVAERHPDRAAQPDFDERRQRILVPGGILATVAAIPEVGAARHPEHAHRPIPGHAELRLHVAVEREDLAVGVPVEVQRVAHAAGEQMEVLAVEGGPGDGSARRLLVAETVGLRPEQRNDAVVRVVAMRRVRRHVGRRHHAVAVDDVEVLAVRRDTGLVNPVVAVAALVAVPGAQRVDGREAAVTLRIAKTMQSRLTALLARTRGRPWSR